MLASPEQDESVIRLLRIDAVEGIEHFPPHMPLDFGAGSAFLFVYFKGSVLAALLTAFLPASYSA
ncbi:hypothetical protein GCM10011328_12230 [Hafnia psychrotolerans]|uniref:Uncharacterized protein n=1 Tax=Hafnia psychrotolerans TaxID=1477018 RepID=A0ABQ1G8R7_9GAMM|nr:hypothetical protein GCM10011328_12230 [Hafnia psychrotolerans]